MKKVLSLVAVFCICAMIVPFLTACSGNGNDPNRKGKINIAAMNGPTMMGLGKLYNEVSGDENHKYKITKEATPDAVIAGLANKNYDVAAMPANNAAILFNNGNVCIQVAVINTLNVLYLLQKASAPEITGLADLSGKTLYMPGQGSTPEFAVRSLLAKNNITNVTIEFETEGSTIAAGLKTAGSKYNYAVLPQPAATTAITGAGAATQVANLTDAWKAAYGADSDIVTGVLVVRKAFLKNNKTTFDEFLAKYKESVDFMTQSDNLATAAQYVVDMGIVPALAVAQNALPKCGIAYIEKTSMKTMLDTFYTTLHGQNANSIGGRVPSNSFYYIG